MTEDITKAMQGAQLVDSDLRQIYKKAIGKNDALVVLAGQLIEQNAKLITVLSQLENV
jgi:hypothetical protein